MDSSVKVPTLPANMVKIKISLLATDKSGVMPVESPTVPNADTSSNNSWIKLYSGSKMHRRNVPIQTSSMERSDIMKALETASPAMLRRNAPICFLVNKHLTSCIRTKKVLVLMPPPVDPGEAPINIRIININNPALVNSPMGYVEKPAVRAETLWKKAPIQDISSVAFSKRVPMIKSDNVVTITTLEWRHSFLKDRFFTISERTRNPKPPKIISPQVVKLSKISDW